MPKSRNDEDLGIKTVSVMVDEEFIRTRDGVRDFPEKLQFVKDSRGRTRGRYEGNEQTTGKPQMGRLKQVKQGVDRQGRRHLLAEYEPEEAEGRS